MSLDENELKTRLEKIEKIFEDQQQDTLNEEALEAFSNKIADTLGNLVESKVQSALETALREKMEALAEGLPDAISDYVDESVDEYKEELSERIADAILLALEEKEKCDKDDAEDGDAEEDEKDDEEAPAEKSESVYDVKAQRILENLCDHMSYNEYQRIKEMLAEQDFNSNDDVKTFFETVVETEEEPVAKVESFVELCARKLNF